MNQANVGAWVGQDAKPIEGCSVLIVKWAHNTDVSLVWKNMCVRLLLGAEGLLILHLIFSSVEFSDQFV